MQAATICGCDFRATHLGEWPGAFQNIVGGRESAVRHRSCPRRDRLGARRPCRPSPHHWMRAVPLLPPGMEISCNFFRTSRIWLSARWRSFRALVTDRRDLRGLPDGMAYLLGASLGFGTAYELCEPRSFRKRELMVVGTRSGQSRRRLVCEGHGRI